MAATAANDTDVNSSFQCVAQTQTHGPHLQTRRTKVPVGVFSVPLDAARPIFYSLVEPTQKRAIA